MALPVAVFSAIKGIGGVLSKWGKNRKAKKKAGKLKKASKRSKKTPAPPELDSADAGDTGEHTANPLQAMHGTQRGGKDAWSLLSPNINVDIKGKTDPNELFKPYNVNVGVDTKKSNKTFLIIGGVVLAIIAAIAIFFKGGKKDKK